MHIPDTMLSPSTCAVCAAVMAPVWVTAAAKVKRTLKSREVPMLALGAAFCFTIMMFNIPALGGTTAHPVAGTLLAILLGPWAAVIGVSVALAIQALFFGDGGLLAFGANCFTMAFALPMVGYAVYSILARKLEARSRFLPLCAALGSFVGINAAAALVAVLLGIQPSLFHEPNGHALYFPFGLSVSLSAMLGTHLLVAGPAEAMVTMLAVAYLQAVQIPMYGLRPMDGGVTQARLKPQPGVARRETLWLALAVMVALTPLGLLAKGDAWGEWDADAISNQIKRVTGDGYVPRGVEASAAHRYQGAGALADYGAEHGKPGYLAAAVVGVGAILLTLLGAGQLLAARERVVPGSVRNPRRDPAMAGKDAPAARSPDDPLPLWLTAPASPALSDAKPSNRYVVRSIADLARRCATAMASETWCAQQGLLQRLDARARLFMAGVLVLTASVLHRLAPLAIIYAAVLLAALFSRIPVWPLVKRVWLTVPLFVGGVTLPVVLNSVTPGREILTVWHHPHLAVTAPGMTVGLMLVLRVGVAVSIAVLLALTTRWAELMSALRALLVPRLFVNTLAMTYRYAILLMGTASEMFAARVSRTVGPETNTHGRRFVGASMGCLFGKTLALSDEVHSAMISRGFTGDMRTLHRPSWRWKDTLLLMSSVALAAAAVLIDRYLGARS